MLIAQVKLPVALRRRDFLLLSQAFECIKELEGERVYEDESYDYNIGRYVIDVTLMSNDKYYKDECECKDGKYYKDGVEIKSWYVHERPKEDYVVIKNRVVILDLEKFYSIVTDVGLDIINVIPIEADNTIKTLIDKIDMLINKM